MTPAKKWRILHEIEISPCRAFVDSSGGCGGIAGADCFRGDDPGNTRGQQRNMETIMKLWILKAKEESEIWYPHWNKVWEHVVKAPTEALARQYACEECGEEGDIAWLDSKHSTCKQLTAKTKDFWSISHICPSNPDPSVETQRLFKILKEIDKIVYPALNNVEPLPDVTALQKIKEILSEDI